MRRFALTLLAASWASTCFASFELALIYNWDTHSIFRYDPVTNTRLGSFGDGELGNYGQPALSVDTYRPGQVAVLNQDGGIRWFNYSTGEYASGVNLGVGLAGRIQLQMLSNGNALVTGQFTDNGLNQTRLYNATSGALISTMHAFGYDHMQAGQSTDGSFWTLTRTLSGSSYSYYLFRYNSAGSYLGYVGAGTSTSNGYRYSMRVQGNQLYMVGAGSDPAPVKGTISGGSVTLTDLPGSYYVTPVFDNVMFGHNGRVHFTQTYDSGGTRYNRWYTIDPVNGYYRFTREMPYSWQIYSTALVVAPEPASLVALGAGIAAVCLRRRRKAR